MESVSNNGIRMLATSAKTYIRNLTNKSHSMTGKIVPYSAPLLSTCLDVFIATVDVSQQPNPFFMDNVLKAQQLVLPCFDFPGQKIEGGLVLLGILHRGRGDGLIQDGSGGPY